MSPRSARTRERGQRSASRRRRSGPRGVIAPVLAAALGGAIALAGAGVWIGSATAQDDDKPAAKPAAKPGKARFIHGDHVDNGVKIDDCEKCHSLEDNWDTAPPTMGRNHEPCNSSGCHADEFFSREPTICTVCHENADPWVKQKALLQARPQSEFGAGSFNHLSHLKLKGGGKATNRACMGCHGNKFKNDEGPKEKSGHSNCAGCHGKTAEPAMGNCGDCHVRGKKNKARAENKWSVSSLFTHTTHGRDVRKGKETACTLCHGTIAEATTLDKQVYPKMQDCDACHDGKHAFKTTGFECYKCHGKTE